MAYKLKHQIVSKTKSKLIQWGTFLKISLVSEQELNFTIPLKPHFW